MTIIKFAGFIIVSLTLFFGAHYLIYISSLRFLLITDPILRRIIFWSLFFLAFSFFPAAFLLRLSPGIFSSLFYLIPSIWMGLLIYLLMALGFTWLTVPLERLMGSGPDMRIVFICFSMMALLVSLYGVIQARDPRLRFMDVKINGLPESWSNRTIVQLSDLHLGSINGEGFIKRVVEKVNEVNPDLILITGDLFDGMGGKLRSFIDPLNSMMASKGKFFITGNHEGYIGLKKVIPIVKETDFKILDNEIVEMEGLQIIGISFPEYHMNNNVRRLLTETGSYDPGKPSILLYHTPTNIEEHHADRGSQQANTYWFPDTSMSLAKEAGIDLQLSGHTHRGQLFPFGLLTKIIYKGYDYGLHQEGDFQIYISSGVGTWGPPMRVGAPPEIPVFRLLN